nr:hypothetical protein [Propionibacterium sp.]
MDEAPSPRIQSRKLGLRVGVAAGLLALAGGLTPTPVAAESLSALHESAAAAARRAEAAEARAAA